MPVWSLTQCTTVCPVVARDLPRRKVLSTGFNGNNMTSCNVLVGSGMRAGLFNAQFGYFHRMSHAPVKLKGVNFPFSGYETEVGAFQNPGF